MKTRKCAAITAVVIFLLTMSHSALAQTPTAWQLPIRIQIETFRFELYAGVHPNATDAFNVGIDTLAPPPAFTPYATLVIPTLPGTLRADFRGPGSAITWRVQIFNAANLPANIFWDATKVPRPGALVLNDSLDMLAQDSVTVSNAAVLTIRYAETATGAASPSAEDFPETFLLNSFPNPFAAGITFEIRVPLAAPGMLRIFNVLGQEIQTFALAPALSPVWLRWDGADWRGVPVPSGIYFCRIELAGAAMVKKFYRMQ